MSARYSCAQSQPTSPLRDMPMRCTRNAVLASSLWYMWFQLSNFGDTCPSSVRGHDHPQITRNENTALCIRTNPVTPTSGANDIRRQLVNIIVLSSSHGSICSCVGQTPLRQLAGPSTCQQRLAATRQGIMRAGQLHVHVQWRRSRSASHRSTVRYQDTPELPSTHRRLR